MTVNELIEWLESAKRQASEDIGDYVILDFNSKDLEPTVDTGIKAIYFFNVE
jgi:hypothetical protein